MVAKRSAAGERTRTINQARALILTGPDDLRRPGGRDRVAAAPPRRRPRLCHPGRAARAGTARGVPGRPARAPQRAHRPPGHRPCPPAARPLRDRAQHRGAAAHRGGRPPRAAAQRGRLGAPVRGRPHPRIVGEGHPPPAEPRRRPAGQPCPVADRVHAHGLRPGHPRLRRTPHERRKVQGRDHPLPEALRRPWSTRRRWCPPPT